MSDFARDLTGEVPLHEAASYFVAMKSFPVSDEAVKTAGVKMAGAAADLMDSLANGGPMPEGKAGRFKPVDEVKEAEKTAATLAEVEGKTTRKMKGVYRDAGISRGGAKGGVVGAALGGIAGALKGGKKGALKGAAGGAAAGAGVGGTVGGVKGTKKGKGVGQHINKVRRGSIAKSMAMQNIRGKLLTQAQKDPEFRRGLLEAARPRPSLRKAAEVKIALGEGAGAAEAQPNMEGGQPTEAAAGPAPQAPAQQVAPQAPPVQDPAAAMPTTAPTVPQNYMDAEVMARAAQAATETGFLRERLNVATEQNTAMQQQVQQAQQELQGLQEQTAASGEQIMQATNEAVQASDRALQQSMAAANMRMGINKMRESFLQLASQDPEQMGTMAQQEQLQAQQAEEQQAVNGQAGAPGQAPGPEAGPGQAPAGAGDTVSEAGPEAGGAPSGAGKGAPGKSTAPNISIKTGAAPPGMLPGALMGAGLAGLHGMRRPDVPQAEENVEQLEGEQTGSFGKAMELAKARMALAHSKLKETNPVAAGAAGMLSGAVGGAVLGSSAGKLHNTARMQGLV